jgi:hypothetical protein
MTHRFGVTLAAIAGVIRRLWWIKLTHTALAALFGCW